MKTVKCDKCQSEEVRAFDNSPLSFYDPAEPEYDAGLPYDNELTVEFICMKCENTFYQTLNLELPMNRQEEAEKAKAVLAKQGYAVDCLWHKEDVQARYKCDDDQAIEIVEAALGNDWLMEQINVTISDMATDAGLEEKEDS